jgi:hypothetical protein
MLPSRGARSLVLPALGYAALALAFAWPLPIHLATHLTGTPGGDTGVYVWNQWVFQHELLNQRSSPYFTETIFRSGRPANLALHNYTTFQNLLALPLIPIFGVVATFNLIHLAMRAVTALAAFLLARHVTGRAPEAWVAGALFAWSPVLLTRGTAHFSLVAAAPLALFALLLLRTRTHMRARDAIALGAVLWWAASTDAYYAVYCVLMAAVFGIARVVTVSRRELTPSGLAVRRALTVLTAIAAILVIAIVVTGGGEIALGGIRIRMRSLYTPMLVCTSLAVLRWLTGYRLSLTAVPRPEWPRLAKFGAIAVVTTSILLSPVLYGAAIRFGDGQAESTRIFWRSSPPGVDVAALLAPNPNHPLAPAAIGQWIATRPNGYIENVASIPLIALAVLGIAWVAGWRPPPVWIGFTITFGLMSLGPFVQVLGVNTHIPGPWALMRYVPVIGLARTPARFSIVMMLGCAVLLAVALAWLGRAQPRRRRLMLIATSVLLLGELLPSPRPLYSAEVPAIYQRVAGAPPGTAVLPLPFGVRDGTMSVGDFNARTLFFQTSHQKPIMGGYLSRVSRRRLSELRGDKALYALAVLSENKALEPDLAAALDDHGSALLERLRIHFVVIDRDRSSEAFRDRAVRALRLELVEADGHFELYRRATFSSSP